MYGNEIIHLLEDPALIQREIDRRRAVARNTDPFRKLQEELRREQVRIEKNSERLVTAYREGLVHRFTKTYLVNFVITACLVGQVVNLQAGC
ncbi:MAG: hypothetical protein M3Z85_04370 [Acidobacteriota bacterium]|nr:hypothetical protein [Acidobacteriota bacterium]